MIYDENNIKYCLLTWDKDEKSHIDSYSNSDFVISGLYNWSKALLGDRNFPKTKDDFNKYNLIHINLTPKNLPLISIVLPKINRNKTKIILNVDFAIEMWGNNFAYPQLFLQEIDKVDYIFAVEENMAELLSNSLKRNVACIPHPSNVEKIKSFKTSNRNTSIFVSGHRYDENFLLPWYSFNKIIPEKWKTIISGAYNSKDKCNHLYDIVLPYLNFEELIKILAVQFLAIESYTLHSYGRFSVECAALGIPCIGPENVSSINRCFPLSKTSFNDITRTSLLINDIINDKEFYKTVSNFAFNASDYYSFKNCKKLLFDFLNSPQ